MVVKKPPEEPQKISELGALNAPFNPGAPITNAALLAANAGSLSWTGIIKTHDSVSRDNKEQEEKEKDRRAAVRQILAGESFSEPVEISIDREPVAQVTSTIIFDVEDEEPVQKTSSDSSITFLIDEVETGESFADTLDKSAKVKEPIDLGSTFKEAVGSPQPVAAETATSGIKPAPERAQPSPNGIKNL